MKQSDAIALGAVATLVALVALPFLVPPDASLPSVSLLGPVPSVALVGAVGGLYLLPSVIAYFRSHTYTVAIFIVNVALGWTFLGWIAALVWAFVDPRRVDREG